MLYTITDHSLFTVKGNVLTEDHPMLGKWLFRFATFPNEAHPEPFFIVQCADTEEEARQQFAAIRQDAVNKGLMVYQQRPPAQIGLANEIEKALPHRYPLMSGELEMSGTVQVLDLETGLVKIGFDSRDQAEKLAKLLEDLDL